MGRKWGGNIRVLRKKFVVQFAYSLERFNVSLHIDLLNLKKAWNASRRIEASKNVDH